MNIEKPCPFCGAKADIVSSTGAWVASCSDMKNCGNMGFVESQRESSYKKILEKWNRRQNKKQGE